MEFLDARRREHGATLADLLREAGVEILASFWYYNNDIENWRLVFVTPNIEIQGPRKLLRETKSFIDRLNGQASFDLYDVDFESPFDAALVSLIGAISGVRGENTTIAEARIGDREITSMFIYRIDVDRLLGRPSPNGNGSVDH